MIVRTPRRARRPARLLVLALAATALLAACAGGSRNAGAAGQSQRPSEAEEPAVTAEPVHPAFTVTLPELEARLAATAAELRPAFAERFAPRILERPEYFLELLRQSFDEPEELFRLVDKEHALPEDYAPTDIVELNRYADRLILNRNDLSLRAIIMPDLFAMIEAARLDGILIDISSTYRSYQYQAGLFERHVQNLGREQAERVSARPGTSQHQLGTTVDFGSITPAFADTRAGRWLAANSRDFGFSLSYPDGYEELTGYSYEPWHFRYISRVGTELETQFFEGLQQHLLEFYRANAEWFRARLRDGGAS